MSLKSRLTRLEERTGVGECPECHGRRVAVEFEAGGLLSTLASPCASCNAMPQIIRVISPHGERLVGVGLDDHE